MKYRLDECIGFRLRRISRIIDAEYRNCLQDFGITEHQMNILFMLKTVGEIHQGQIGNRLVLERSTVSRNVKVLEKEGLLSKSNDYQPKVALTDKGETLVSELLPKWEKLMDSLVDKIGKENYESIKSFESKLM